MVVFYLKKKEKQFKSKLNSCHILYILFEISLNREHNLSKRMQF